MKSVTGEDVTTEALGGAGMHSRKSGVAHFKSASEEECLQLTRQLISYIPQNNMESVPTVTCNDPINRADDVLNEILENQAIGC